MGIFNKIFGESNASKNENNIAWIDLNTLDQLESLKERSKIKTQLIFKHSTRCGISRMVKKQFEADYELTEDAADLHYLDLIAHRNISNELAETFNVVHESPQLLVVKNENVVAHDSHSGINTLDLQQFV